MVHLGNIFRELRRSKSLTIKFICQDLISPSAVSQFEREKIILNGENLLKLLDRLNINAEEFMFITQTKNNSPRQIDFFKQFKKAKRYNSLTIVNKLMNSEDKNNLKYCNIRHQHNLLLLKQLKLKIQNKPFDSDATNIIHDYLFLCDQWSMYELNLLLHSSFFLSTKQLEIHSKNIYRNTSLLTENEYYDNILLEVHLNVLFKFILSKESERIEQQKKIIKNYLLSTTSLLYKNYFNFLLGLYLIISGSIIEGHEKCQKAIEILEHLEYEDLALDYKNSLKLIDENNIETCTK